MIEWIGLTLVVVVVVCIMSICMYKEYKEQYDYEEKKKIIEIEMAFLTMVSFIEFLRLCNGKRKR